MRETRFFLYGPKIYTPVHDNVCPLVEEVDDHFVEDSWTLSLLFFFLFFRRLEFMDGHEVFSKGNTSVKLFRNATVFH